MCVSSICSSVKLTRKRLRWSKQQLLKKGPEVQVSLATRGVMLPINLESPNTKTINWGELKKTLYNGLCPLKGYFCISSKFSQQLSSPPRNKQTNNQCDFKTRRLCFRSSRFDWVDPIEPSRFEWSIKATPFVPRVGITIFLA